ncbi:MAG: histidine phosphatase family protein, partial [Cyanobacteria bacterium J06636_27]
YLLKPDGEGEFDIIANLLPEEWVELSEGVELPDTGMANGASLIPVEDGESGNGWNPGDSFDLVTPPPTYEGELAPGEQANAEFVDLLEGQELLDELQDGGYVIYFRHAQTERDFADQVTADVNNFSTQRVLSEFGVKQSLAIGEGFELSEIPIGSVTTSEYGRAVETAAIAFNEYLKDSALNFLPFEDYTDEQVEEMRTNVLPLLTEVPETGTNSIIVGHDDLFEAGAGIYPDPQGIAYLLKPDGEGEFDIIANLLPEEWVELSQDVVPEIPVVSLSVNTTTISEEEGTLFTLSFNVNGSIPESGLEVALGGDLLPFIDQLDFSNFDFSNPDNVQGLTIGDFREDGSISITLFEPSASFSVRVFDDVVKEADANFDLMLLEGDGYSVNQDGNGATVT